MALVVGIDPGSSCTGVAVVEDGAVVAVQAFRLKRGSTAELVRQLVAPVEMLFESVANPDLVVVEGQHYHLSSKASPDNILKLANVAGAIAGVAATRSSSKLAVPSAEEWKGQTPKPINQARTFAHYGIAYTKGPNYCWPKGCKTIAGVLGYGSLKKSDWKEVADALGLARYGEDLLGS